MISQAQLNNPKNIPWQWTKTDTTQTTVDFSEITIALGRKAFPSIDYPDFLAKEKGASTFFPHEPVIAVAINGEAKAYPLNMLTMHEMSNDSLGGVPILPTYCPLCNSSVVYSRKLKHKDKEYLLDFEVSGMLRNSDMVMADKQTESWWQQLMGSCLVGELAGAQLDVIPSLVISVAAFFDRYPDGMILSPKTGTSSEDRYGKNPYVGYDAADGKPYDRYFDHEVLDSRLAPMERVIDVRGREGYKVYPFSTVAKAGVINDTYDGFDLVIFYKEGTVSVLDQKEIALSKQVGSATLFSPVVDNRKLTFKKKRDYFQDIETKSKWDITGNCFDGKFSGKSLTPLPHSNHFAFAFLRFFPDAEIYLD